MSFNVRIFAYGGIVAALQPQVVQQSADSVFLLRDPYIVGYKEASNGATEVAFPALPAGTKLLRVEVDDGNAIRYEVRMGANQRVASTNSPTLSGREIIYASDGAVFAFVDAAAT
jgi:hypothetical protein